MGIYVLLDALLHFSPHVFRYGGILPVFTLDPSAQSAQTQQLRLLLKTSEL